MKDYTIAIRTLGTAGEKYLKLLNSIKKLENKPKKIIVVLPNGYNLPKERLGYEEFVFVEKSMILQRIKALDYIDTKYVLFCDDDVEFGSDFVDKLITPLEKYNYVASAGPLESFWPQNNFKYKIASLLGGACIMLFKKKRQYIRILKTGGWSYNYNYKNFKVNYTESLPWTCFMMRTDVAKELCMEDEMWLEKNKYAAFDDRVMFYKIVKHGYKSCVVTDAIYIHNDAKTSTRGNNKPAIYSGAFNHFIFWHRYIYSFDSFILKIWDIICISYYIFMCLLYNVGLVLLRKQSYTNLKLICNGFKDAIAFLFTQEYKELKPVLKRRI